VRQQDLIDELARGGARAWVRGSTLRALGGEPVVPADLDLVVARGDEASLAAALAAVGARLDIAALRRAGSVRVLTSYGPVDVVAGDPAGAGCVVYAEAADGAAPGVVP
jgi:hypothetical protein